MESGNCIELGAAAMSPSTRSKSKEKSAGRDQKVSPKQASTNGGTSASAYNPVSGTFHMLDSVTVYSGGSPHNVRFKNIDDGDENSGSFGTNTDSDTISNNGSCSGESEDQKDKNGTGRLDNPPGLIGGNDKKDKIRQKNEKKHQRQKEKRAQELRDRCTGYLMSRKLEALSQQLVAMGFSSERATMALILNEGRVEDSVNWLLEGGEGEIKESTPGNLKIDISEELAHIAGMEIRFKCARAEVERTVVGCEGDLQKAAELLRNRLKDASLLKDEDKISSVGTKVTKDTHGNSNRISSIPPQASSQRNGQSKNHNSVSGTHSQKREEKDYNYAKGRPHTIPLRVPAAEGTAKNIQPLGRVPAKGDWQGLQSQVDKKLTSPISWSSSPSTSSVPYAVTINPQVGTPSKTLPAEMRHRTVSLDSKPLQIGPREPVVVMQRPQSSYTTQLPVASVGVSSAPASSILSSGWTGNYMDSSVALNYQYSNGSTGLEHLKGTAGKVPVVSSAKGITVTDVQGHFQPFLPNPADSIASGWSSGQIGFDSLEIPLSSSTLLSPIATNCPTPSSLGLFSGWSSGPSGSSVDWSMGSMVNCDYTNIDWSVQASPSSQPDARSNRFSHGLPSMEKIGENVNSQGNLQHLSAASSPSSDNSLSYDIWLGSKLRDSNSANGVQEKSISESENATSSIGVHEWTSPFAGKDLFSLPRQLVPTPPL